LDLRKNMIVCPNCNHQNPEGAKTCEACLTPLPETTNCPNCGATVQTDATFCGQCGYSLQPSTGEPEGEAQASTPDLPATEVSTPAEASNEEASASPPAAQPDPAPEVSPSSESESSIPSTPTPVAAPQPAPTSSPSSTTQLQVQTARLVHVQTNTTLELPQHLDVIHLGKPNDMIPPDIDVSGFPNSEIVSRIHADIRVEADAFYIEDVGSSNGTYINNLPLPKGNRHRLRPGDRIALGKGDMMTFLFQLS
jgi:ribosomal protein L40E